MTQPSAPTAATPPDNTSFAEDLIDIFVSPAKVFARRAKGNPMAPYLVVCVILIVLFFASKNALAPIFDAEMQKGIDAAMKANPQLTPDVMEKAKPMMNITVNVGGVVVVPCLLLILGLITWITGRVLGGTLSFGTGLLIASYAWMPRIIDSVLGLVQGLTLDVSKMTSHLQLSASVARFLDPPTGPQGFYQLMGQIDIFSIWVAILFAVGLAYAGKVGKGNAIAGGVIMWVVGAIPAIWALLLGR
jgi:hypothetical protein